MTNDVREVLAEALWPKAMRPRQRVRGLVGTDDAARMLATIRLLSGDAGTVSRLRQYRREADDSGHETALGALRRDLTARLNAGLPRRLFADAGAMQDARLGARILSAVIAARRRGLRISDPRRPGFPQPARGAVVAALREVVEVNDAAVARGCVTRALSDPDWRVRFGAVRVASGLLGHRNVRTAFEGIMQDEVAAVRALAVRKLARRAGVPDVDAMISTALCDMDLAVRRQAVRGAVRSRQLAGSVALMAFDPAADVAQEVRAALGDEAISRAVREAARHAAGGEPVNRGLLRVILLDGGLPEEEVSRVARRRLATLWRRGRQVDLVASLQALEWIQRPDAATIRLAARIARAPDMERAVLAVVQKWPEAAALQVGTSRLSVDPQGAASMRASLCEAIVAKAQANPLARKRITALVQDLDEVSASGAVWAIGGRFPGDEAAALVDLLRTSAPPGSRLLRTLDQVEDRLSGTASAVGGQ